MENRKIVLATTVIKYMPEGKFTRDDLISILLENGIDASPQSMKNRLRIMARIGGLRNCNTRPVSYELKNKSILAAYAAGDIDSSGKPTSKNSRRPSFAKSSQLIKAMPICEWFVINDVMSKINKNGCGIARSTVWGKLGEWVGDGYISTAKNKNIVSYKINEDNIAALLRKFDVSSTYSSQIERIINNKSWDNINSMAIV